MSNRTEWNVLYFLAGIVLPAFAAAVILIAIWKLTE